MSRAKDNWVIAGVHFPRKLFAVCWILRNKSPRSKTQTAFTRAPHDGQPFGSSLLPLFSPDLAKQTIERVKATLYAYYVEMQNVLGTLFRVLKNNKRCILVVAEPHFWKIEDEFFYVPNSEILRELAEKSHFHLEFDVVIPLAKAFKRHRITNGERLLVLRKGTSNENRSGSQLVGDFQKVNQQQTNWKQSLNQTASQGRL